MRPVAGPDVTADVVDQPTDHVASISPLIGSGCLAKSASTLFI